MEESSIKRQRGIGIGAAIFNVIAGCAGFALISFAELSMWLNYAVMAVLWIGLFAGLFFGIRLLVLDKRKACGLTAVILTGIMLLLFAVDNVIILREQSGDWDRDESSFAVESDFPSEKPMSNLNQADIQSDTVIWINAIYAIPTYADSRDYRFIGGTMPYIEDASSLELMLESGWGVTDRKSALECVEKLIQKGHQSSYMEYMEKLSMQGLLDLQENEVREYFEGENLEDKELNKYIAAYRIYKNDAENGIIAWDYCRAVQLLGYYYVMDYITLEECMDKSLEIAKQLQSTYASWDEMANSYLLGYEFWSGQSLNEFGTDAYLRKSEYEDIMAYEPYIFAIDWNYELQDTWTGVEHSVATEDIYDVVCDAYTDYVQRMGYEMEEGHWLNGSAAEE